MKKKTVVLFIISATVFAAVIGGIFAVVSADTELELYRIGYIGRSDENGLLWQLAAMPFLALLISFGVFIKKDWIRITASLLSIAACIYRLVGFSGIYTETNIEKIVTDVFNNVMYGIMAVSFAAAIVLIFISFFSNEKASRFTHGPAFVIGIALAAFFLIIAVPSLIITLGDIESYRNLLLLSLSCFTDAAFFMITVFANRISSEDSIDEITYFKNLANNRK